MDRDGKVVGVFYAHIRQPAIRQEVDVMEDIKHPSDRIIKVERSFEWSRLENQLMASVYGHVLPVVQPTRDRSSIANCLPGCDQSSNSVHGWQSYVTGA